MRVDLHRLEEDAEKKGRVLGIWEAQTVAGYVRALSGIAKARASVRDGRGGGLGRTSMDELIAEAMKVPELRAALKGLDE